MSSTKIVRRMKVMKQSFECQIDPAPNDGEKEGEGENGLRRQDGMGWRSIVGIDYRGEHQRASLSQGRENCR